MNTLPFRLCVLALMLAGAARLWADDAAGASPRAGVVSGDLPAGYVKRSEGRSVKDLMAEQVEVTRLQKGAALRLTVTEAELSDVLRFVADKCEINYVVLPTAVVAKTPVTVNSYGNPWQLLNLIADLYSVGFTFDRGTWVFYHLNPEDLYSRTYTLAHNPGKTYDGGGGSGGGANGTGGSAQQGGSQQGQQTNNQSMNGQQGNGTGGSGDMATKVFSVDVSQIETTVKQFLGLQTTGFRANDQGEGTALSFPEPGKAGPGASAGIRRGADSTSIGGKGLVTYLKDNNALYIVATRQQHEWIAQYLDRLDRPKPLVELEIKFVETSQDPSLAFGLDWSSTLAKGINVNLTGLSKQVQILPGASVAPSPQSLAILSASDLGVSLKALASDSRSTSVQYPRMVTTSGQEVVMRSVVQTPVLASSSSVTAGAQATNQVSVQYKDVGTIVNILPERLEGDNVLLNVSMNISSITGSDVLAGNTYPIVSTRSFTYQVIVKSGYSLAVGGLEEAIDQTATVGIPGLQAIPFFGHFFASDNRTRTRRNLLMFITPTMLKGYDNGGLTTTPRTTAPLTGPRAPRLSADALTTATAADLARCATDLEHDLTELSLMAKEARITAHEGTQMKALRNELDLMDLRLAELKHKGETSPESEAAVAQARERWTRTTADVKQSNAFIKL